MKVRTIKQNELSPEVRDAARRAMAGCPHGNTARRKCVHCDVEDSERALAAADRLAEAVKKSIRCTDEFVSEQGDVAIANEGHAAFEAMRALLATYLAERGR